MFDDDDDVDGNDDGDGNGDDIDGNDNGLTVLLLAVHALVLRLVLRPPKSALLQTPATKVFQPQATTFFKTPATQFFYPCDNNFETVFETLQPKILKPLQR